MAKKNRQIGEPDLTRANMYRTTRQVVPRNLGLFPYNYIPRRNYEQYDISKLEDSRLKACQLLALLPDLNADVGLAVWNINRLGSLGFSYTVKDSQGQDDENLKNILDGIVDRINEQFGGIGNLITQWLQSAYLQGAVAGEIVLTENLNDIDDIYAVDPACIVFNNTAEGKLQANYVSATGGIIPLNHELFYYIPIDPMIDDPYGRPPAAPALQDVWFDIGIMVDLKKVVHNQGWPRIDIKLLGEVILNNAPASVKNDAAKLSDWLNAQLDAVTTAYNNLQPDDSFVHYDCVEVNQATEGGQLFDPTAVMRIIERRLIKGLKQIPILMASNEATTETLGTVQWQIFVAGLESLQAPIRFILSKMFQVALEVLGYQGRVEVEFEKLRTTDRLNDANAEAVEIKNAIQKWAAGWQTWAESAIEITGSAPPEGAIEPDPESLGIASLSGNNANNNNNAARIILSSEDRDDTRIDSEIALLRR